MLDVWQNLIDGLNRTTREDRIVRSALTSVLPEHKKRIFQLGNAEGGRIGTYSTKKISISAKNQARQTGKTVFKGGYAEYKTAIGKNPGFVNLRNTDQMMMDYGLVSLGQNEFGFGFQNAFNFDKTQWAEEKYRKKIFVLTTEEQKLLENLINIQITRTNSLNG